jgi:transposase
MAFIRSERKNGEVYLSICENERIDNKIVQNRLYNLGKLTDYKPESLRRMGERLYVLGGGNLEDLIKSFSRELGRYNYGFPLIINYLFKVYDLDTYFRRMEKRFNLSYPLRDVVVLMLCNRWSDPDSKLGTYDTQEDYLGIARISLQWLYRSLDKLSLSSVSLQTYMYERNLKLLDYELDIVFYDVTTFYFDSYVEEEDSLRQKGFSKDGKVGQTQILLGLLLDKHRNPVGYELYRGDTYEGHTLKDSVKNLKSRYRINKVIVVADSGMLNTDNLLTINDNGYEFIVGERLKNLPRNVQNKLLDRSDYAPLVLPKAGKTEEKIHLTYKIVMHEGRKILCTYSEKRAAKDRHEREEKIVKGKFLINNPSSMGRKAGIYYLKANHLDLETGEISDPKSDKKTKVVYELDTAKIAQAEQYDGLKAIATSEMNLSNEDILLKYKELYQIEQTFRTFKSFIETRPMFHWTDERIKGHFCLCYLSFCLLNYLQNTLKRNGLDHSENDIRKIFNKMQVSHLQQNEQHYYLRAPLSDAAKEILKVLKIKQLPDLITKELKINELV